MDAPLAKVEPPHAPPGGYHCPGESQPISRAIHLGRLARYWPGCRECRYRQDASAVVGAATGEVNQAASGLRFDSETVCGEYGPGCAEFNLRSLAMALGIHLGRTAKGREVAVAFDGRPLSARLSAAATEGLRHAGCSVVDLGATTAPCLASTIAHLKADGGLMIGGESGKSVQVSFFGRLGGPLSATGGLDRISEIYRAGAVRPVRTAGGWRRFAAEATYLAGLQLHFHALRPLRFGLSCGQQPLLRQIEALLSRVACQPVLLRRENGAGPQTGIGESIADVVKRDQLHFGVHLAEDGETILLVDERGMAVAPWRLATAIFSALVESDGASRFVSASMMADAVESSIRSAGGRLSAAGDTRESVHAAMAESVASVGVGPENRIWLADPTPVSDGLAALTQLLILLSRSDRPLSVVLDEAHPGA